METTPPADNDASFAYGEPATVLLLVVTSFLLLLNVINMVLDRFLYCGLIGQILLGVLYGQPGARWLGAEAQVTIQTLGYLGLVLIVYECGLNTSVSTLRSNLHLSALVAFTGVAVPIGLSFTLMLMLPIGPLQAFAAGASLCVTSLGTTCTVLNTSGLTDTKLGITLSSAAMIDDVIGLVMIQIIQNISVAPGASFQATIVIRPVFVSLGLAMAVPLVCRWAILPARRSFGAWRKKTKSRRLVPSKEAAFIWHTLLLIGLCVGAYYAGTSILFAAYLAGAIVTWRDSSTRPRTGSDVLPHAPTTHDSRDNCQAQIDGSKMTGLAVYHHYYHPALQRILRPFFFASIGFSIPITQLFSGPVVWRGIVYSILMTIGKLICGLWLVRFSASFGISEKMRSMMRYPVRKSPQTAAGSASGGADETPCAPGTATPRSDTLPLTPLPSNAVRRHSHSARPPPRAAPRPAIPKPLSLYPPAILGSAMVARGEIGFLISSLAESHGVFAGATTTGDQGEGGAPAAGSELFLVVTWAILSCTVLGPLVVGLLVKRVRRLQGAEDGGVRERYDHQREGRGPLGVWGVDG